MDPGLTLGGGKRNGGGGASNRGKVSAILESVLADLSSSIEVFLRRDAGSSGKFRFISGLFLAGDELSSFVVESLIFKEVLLVDAAPVVASCTALAESLVHAGLGLGSVLD